MIFVVKKFGWRLRSSLDMHVARTHSEGCRKRARAKRRLSGRDTDAGRGKKLERPCFEETKHDEAGFLAPRPEYKQRPSQVTLVCGTSISGEAVTGFADNETSRCGGDLAVQVHASSGAGCVKASTASLTAILQGQDAAQSKSGIGELGLDERR